MREREREVVEKWKREILHPKSNNDQRRIIIMASDFNEYIVRHYDSYARKHNGYRHEDGSRLSFGIQMT